MKKTINLLIYAIIILIAIAVFFKFWMPYTKYLLYVSLFYLFIYEPFLRYKLKKNEWYNLSI